MKDPLRAIPGVGPSIAADLRAIGVNDPTGLRGKNPERLYARSNALSGVVQDRCLLTSRHQPELLKWWNWSDAALASTSSRRRSSRPPTAPRRPASSARR
jgi:adenine-specific DNA glycosylase